MQQVLISMYRTDSNVQYSPVASFAWLASHLTQADGKSSESALSQLMDGHRTLSRRLSVHVPRVMVSIETGQDGRQHQSGRETTCTTCCALLFVHFVHSRPTECREGDLLILWRTYRFGALTQQLHDSSGHTTLSTQRIADAGALLRTRFGEWGVGSNREPNLWGGLEPKSKINLAVGE